MRFTKSQSLFVAVGAIVLFFAGGILMVQRKEHAPVVRELPGIPTPEAAPSAAADGAHPSEPKFTLSDFSRSEMRDGRKIWEIKAAEGSYSPGNSSAALRKAKLWLYGKDGDVIEVDAGSATLTLDGAALAQAELYNGVKVVRNNEVTIETDRAVYDKVKNIVHAPGRVTMKSQSLDIEGRKLDVRVDTKEVHLAEDVKSVVRTPQKPAAGNNRGRG